MNGLRGSIKWREHEAKVSWSLRVDHQGHITVAFARVRLTQETAWMLDISKGNEFFGSWASVHGRTADGVIVTSEHVHIASYGDHQTPRGTFLRLTGEATRIRIDREALPRTSQGLRVIYETVGMEGFAVQRAETKVGRISLAGAAKVSNYDALFGHVELLAPPRAIPVQGWLDRGDALADRVLDMISLAEGRLVRWSIRHVARGRTILRSDFHGHQRTGAPHDGAGHFLNLQPFLNIAVSRYTPALQHRTGFHVALQWFMSHPPYREQQLLAVMTALEHLVATFVTRRHVPRQVDPRSFKVLKRRLTQAFDSFAQQPKRRRNGSLQKQLARIKQKIGSLNDAPFKDKLFKMLRAYRVPLAGIEHDIPEAINARHDIVHKGIYSDDPGASERLFEHVMVLRELLKRIFLTLIQYRGSYATRFLQSGRKIFPPQDVDGADAAEVSSEVS